jgi:hypothetical protein
MILVIKVKVIKFKLHICIQEEQYFICVRCQPLSLSGNSSPFMKLKFSFLCSQDPAIDSYEAL